MARFQLLVNGEKRAVTCEPAEPLLYVLREQLDLTGAKYGCGEGQCGACTVLVEGLAKRACVLPVSEVSGKAITTIEGLAQGEKLHPVQQAFLDHGAFQCGYCTPGMILAAVSLLKEKTALSAEDVKRGMNGNICRCGTYPRIVAAVRQAGQAAKRG